MKSIKIVFYFLLFSFKLSGQSLQEAITTQESTDDVFVSRIVGDTLLTSSMYSTDTFLYRTKSTYFSTNNNLYEVFNYEKFLSHDTFLFYTKCILTEVYDEVRILIPDTVFNIDSIFPIFRFELFLIRIFPNVKDSIHLNPKYILEHSHDSGLQDYNPTLGFLGTYYWFDKERPNYIINETPNYTRESIKIRDRLKY